MASIETLNYSTHAVESMRDLARQSKPAPLVARRFIQLAELLEKAVKFILPPAGELLEVRSLSENHPDLLRLPFPLVALEYQMPPHGELLTGALAEVQSTRRIALCWDESFAAHASVMPDYKQPGLYVLSFFYIDEVKTWASSALGCFIPRDNALATVDEASEELKSPAYEQVFQVLRESGAIGKKSSTFQARYGLVLPEVANQMIRELGEDSAFARMVLDVRDEIITAWQFCLVVNCANVRQQVVAPPAKLNAKRLKNDRVPFFEARVLTLPDEPPNAHGARGDGDSGRAGPRAHLRRGHLRTLASGRATFVRATVVGSASLGFIDKQYAVPPSSNRSA